MRCHVSFLLLFFTLLLSISIRFMSLYFYHFTLL